MLVHNDVNEDGNFELEDLSEGRCYSLNGTGIHGDKRYTCSQ